MMKELLVMVSEEFRKEYHETTGKIYRKLKSSVESFMIEDGIVTVIYTDERSKVRTTLHIPEKHYIGCLEFDSDVDQNSFFNEDTIIRGYDKDAIYGCFVRWIDYGREVESVLFEKHIDGNVIINYFKTLENREIAHLSIPRRNIIKLDKLANGMKVGTWFE